MNNKKTSYKLLSLDLDGTLLSPILHRAKNADCVAIQEYMSAGGIPFINTGRAPWAIEKTVNRINKHGDQKIKLISCLNGSYIKDLNDGQIIETKISHEYCKKILEIVKRFKGVTAWFYLPKGLETQTVYVHPFRFLFKVGYHLSHLKTLKDESNLSSFKIDILSIKKNVVAKIYRELINNNLNQVVNLSHSSPRLIEVTPLGINKGHAINFFAKKYDISSSEIVSMGDSFNDLSGFNNSALSIGISPTNLNFLEHCDEVVDHKSRGVKQAIYSYILKDEINQDYKLIFTDLDGTLIDNKTKLFSNQTKLALQQCTNHLIPIAIASGRCIHDEINIVKSMKLNPKTNIYIIGNNGATIFDIFTNKYISQSPIDDADARKIFSILLEYTKQENGKLGFIIYQHSTDLLFYNEEFWKPFNFKKTGREDQYDPWSPSKPVYVTEYPNDIICYKYVVKFPNAQRALQGCEELRKTFPNLEICLSSDVNLEINKKGINKGFAAEKLFEKINVDPNDVLVLGDGQNDIPALKLTKHSFVPSYAPSYVKETAQHIIDNVDVTSFASTVINQYVFKKGSR